MQAAKDATASVKESAANTMASAHAGIEKTKATIQGKVESMAAHGPVEKEMAKERKEDRIQNAEAHKQEAREHNAAAKQAACGGQPESVHGGMGGPTHHH